MSGSRELVPVDRVTALQAYDFDHHVALKEAVRGPARLGAYIIGIFVIGFGGFAGTVPLAGGAVAPGIISPEGSRRTVQHLEGGIIRTLNVRDGDVVEKGQPLLVLENVQAKANYDLLLKQQRTLRVTKARLDAESAGKDEVEFPADLEAAGPAVALMMAAQQELFVVRRTSYESKNRILRQRMGQLREQIRGFEAQVMSARRQIDFLEEEIEGKRTLAQRGYLAKPDLLRMLRMQAELTGRLGQYEAAISEAQQQIGEAELQLLANDAARADQVATQLDQVRAELNGLDEKLLASGDVLMRTVIPAPLAGTVVNLKFKTVSGVIQPGAPILDIVPMDEKLMIETRISPTDVDVVQNGLKAQIQLSAISTRSAPRVTGIVRSISADRMVDESSKPYYLARVEVDRDDLHRISPKIELIPGMPVDVLIVTGERTIANYLLRPFLDAIWKTLREA